MRLPQPHPQRISPKGFMHEAQTRNGVLCVLSGKKALGISSRPFVDQKEVAVAVAVLRGPPCPLWTKGVAVAILRGPSRIKKKSQLPFFAVLRGPSWTERSCRCNCRSPWPSVSSVDKKCCRCSSSRPFADQKEAAVAVIPVSPRPFADQKEVAVAVLLSLRRQNQLQHTKCHQKRSVQDFPQSPYSLQLQLMSIPFETESPRASQKPRRRPPTRVNRPR